MGNGQRREIKKYVQLLSCCLASVWPVLGRSNRAVSRDSGGAIAGRDRACMLVPTPTCPASLPSLTLRCNSITLPTKLVETQRTGERRHTLTSLVARSVPWSIENWRRGCRRGCQLPGLVYLRAVSESLLQRCSWRSSDRPLPASSGRYDEHDR